MTPEEIKFFVGLAGSLGAGAVVAIICIWLFVKFGLTGYLDHKGRNLATKDEIGDITRQVQQVTTEYQALLEVLKGRQQLRMACGLPAAVDDQMPRPFYQEEHYLEVNA